MQFLGLGRQRGGRVAEAARRCSVGHSSRGRWIDVSANCLLAVANSALTIAFSG